MIFITLLKACPVGFFFHVQFKAQDSLKGWGWEVLFNVACKLACDNMQLQAKTYTCPSCGRGYSQNEFGRDRLGSIRCRHCIALGKASLSRPAAFYSVLDPLVPQKPGQVASPPITPESQSSAVNTPPNLPTSEESAPVYPPGVFGVPLAYAAPSQPQIAAAWYPPTGPQPKGDASLLSANQSAGRFGGCDLPSMMQFQCAPGHNAQLAQQSGIQIAIPAAQLLQMPVAQIKPTYLTPLESHLLTTFVTLVQSRI